MNLKRKQMKLIKNQTMNFRKNRSNCFKSRLGMFYFKKKTDEIASKQDLENILLQ